MTFRGVLEAEEKKMAVASLAERVSGLALTDSRKTEPPLSQRMLGEADLDVLLRC
jgi:hypothetical protein